MEQLNMIIIDGHNLIGAMKNLNLNDPNAKEKLLKILDKYQKILNCKIIVVFDCKTNYSYELGRYENIDIYYPSVNESADDIIKHLIDKKRNRYEISIISSDNEIKNYAKKMRVSNQSSNSFIKEIDKILSANIEEKEKYLDPLSIEEWIKLYKKRK